MDPSPSSLGEARGRVHERGRSVVNRSAGEGAPRSKGRFNGDFKRLRR
jgi:hypothetical protein